MGTITSIIALLGTILAGIFLHVLAHDFCERAPTLARGLLSKATSSLPAALRDRYAEEWAAHLADCEGVLAKLWHALGCLWCARRMQHQSLEGIKVEVSFMLAGLGQTAVRTNLREVSFWMSVTKVCSRTKITMLPCCILLFVFLRRLRADALTRTDLTDNKFWELLKASKREDWVPVAVNLSNERMNVELMSLFRALGKADAVEAVAAWLETNQGAR